MCNCSPAANDDDALRETFQALYRTAREYAQRAGEDPDNVDDMVSERLDAALAGNSDAVASVADRLADDSPTDNTVPGDGDGDAPELRASRRIAEADGDGDDAPAGNSDGLLLGVEDYRETPDRGSPVGQTARERLDADGRAAE